MALFNSANLITAQFSHLNGNNGGGNNNNGGGSGGNSGGGNGNGIEGLVYFYHPDHLGSSSYITDALGEVAQHLEYFAFGETFVEEHSNKDRTPYLYNAKELDEETGLYYYGARYYDPVSSVWQSVDPPMLDGRYLDGQLNNGVLNPNNLAVYGYTWQNPIKLTDPSGEAPGDPFKSVIEAVNDFGEYYNSASITMEREFGSWVYYNPYKDEYSYTIANIGPEKGVKERAEVVPNNDIPENAAGVHTVHTHAEHEIGRTYHGFSKPDIEGSKEFNQNDYMISPEGRVYEYDVKNNKTIRDVPGASQNIPSDRNTPASLRNNRIDPVDTKPIYRDPADNGKIHNQKNNQK